MVGNENRWRKRRVNQERLGYSVVHIRNSNYKQIELDFKQTIHEALKNEKNLLRKVHPPHCKLLRCKNNSWHQEYIMVFE